MKLNKTWANTTAGIIYEIRERREKNVLHYEWAIVRDGKELHVAKGYKSKETARRHLKELNPHIEGQFKTKRAPRKKVNAVKVEYDGHEFDSMTERDFYIYLLNTKLVSNIELQKTFHLLDGYELPSIVNKKGTKKVRPKVYTPDFVCHIEGTGVVAFEVKGSKLAIPRDFSLRKHMFEQQYGIELVVAVYKKKTDEWELS
ncbi:DUF1064 domain-containing protein [Bacillus cereus group sp. Bc252]|uniref:DUF1064 domain-containing protein n=1 Tax=Bacillus TaxID=1386 RepID=UPI0021CEAF5D|nr:MULTISPECIES: DUF1064 domain-containing protein [Bacillus cereus group]MCU5206760.1 DUF1064 domain-containing protein [Bacillus paranthracis]MDA2160260.1 DUF1064 domain-containing protein [Bacillus cereus group sp. Bc252]HDR7786436.1 DUF1064 domain-containing protein [Bacillus paranthracis]